MISGENGRKKPVRVIVGPTATGKSALAVKLAKEENGVVVNADSMQIYNALPLLTAAPSTREREEIPHRLYGAFEPGEKCNAQRWADMALKEIEKIHAKGQLPIIVGGTGLYIKALTKGLAPVPEVPDDIRQLAVNKQKELGNPAFHEALSRKDPLIEERLHPNDTQRLIRAWEVFEHTGKSIVYWQNLPDEKPPAYLQFFVRILNPGREELYECCNARFEKMIEKGAVEEVREFDLRIQGGEIPADAAVTHALGFHPLQAHVHGGISLEEAIEAAKAETRRYAKRQTTWFKNQLDEKPA